MRRAPAALATTIAAVAVAIGCGGGREGGGGAQARAETQAARAHHAGKPPVVFVMLEEISLAQWLDRSGHIDARWFPNIAQLARGATLYRNYTAVGDRTSAVTAAILASTPYRLGVHATPSALPGSIFTVLAHGGYRVNGRDETSAFCPRRICRRGLEFSSAPPLIRYLFSGRRAEGYERWLRAVRPHGARPTFDYAHILLPHEPLEYFPDGRLYRQPHAQPQYSLSGARAAGDPWLVKAAWQRQLIQMEYVDTMIGQLVARLKAQGRYEKSLIVLTADNGQAYGIGDHDTHVIDHATAAAIASTPLIVKFPDQPAGRVVNRHVRAYDLLPLIAHTLRLRIPWRTVGTVPVPGAAIPGATRLHLRDGGILSLSLAELRRHRAELVDRKLRTFAHGLYAIGPERQLTGRALRDLRVVGSRRLRLRLIHPGRFRHVDPRARIIPALVTAYASGALARRGLPVAVAVDGKVAATGYVGKIKGQRRLEVGVLLREDAFTAGANRVEVLGIRRTGGEVELLR